MVAWLNKWQACFKPASSNQKSDVPAHWQLPIVENMTWSAAERDCVKESEEKRLLCSIRSTDTCEKMQTVILSSALNHNQLLLDPFFPAPNDSVLGREFKLCLLGSNTMKIRLVVRELLALDTGPAYLGEVIYKEMALPFKYNPIFGDRLYFSQAPLPPAILWAPMSPRIHGTLLELSEHDCVIAHYSNHRPFFSMPTGECRISFSDSFSLLLPVSIQQTRMMRSPVCHTLITLSFIHSPKDERGILRSIIRERNENPVGASYA